MDPQVQRVSLTPSLLRYVQKNKIASIAIVPGRNNCCAFRCAKAEVKMNITLRCEDASILEAPLSPYDSAPTGMQGIAQSSAIRKNAQNGEEEQPQIAPLCFHIENVMIFLHPALQAAQEELTLGMDRFFWACAFWADGLTLTRRCPKTGSAK